MEYEQNSTCRGGRPRNGTHENRGEKAIDASVRIAVRAFREGESLTMSGLGTFRVVQRTPRTGRNPRTGAQVKVPARKVLKFRSTTDLE